MKKQNKRVYLIKFLTVAFFIAFGGCFFALQAQAGDPNEEGDTYIDINQDTVWHSTDDLNFTKTVYVNLGATLTIEKGAKIKFGKDINGGDTYILVNGGRLIADGTQKEPISITADADQQYYLLEFRRNYWEDMPEYLPSFLRYVEIYGGGYAWDTDCPECISFFHNLIPMARAEIRGVPALFFAGGKVHLENCAFHDNEYSDVEIQYNESDSSTGVDNYLEIVNSNFEKNGNSVAVKSELWCKDGSLGCASKILLKNNWYDSSLGPKVAPDYIIGGEMIEGDYTLEDFRSKSLIADPAIIIPGIMGSAQVNNVWKIDPITHSFDDLISSLQKTGYIKNINLFEFPYEWRSKNADTANILKGRIQEIINETRVSKVDIVAHSMGGLISRSYIEGTSYQNNIDQLITLGTPHKGAPKAYLYWEAAEFGLKINDSIMKHHFKNEAKHAGYDDLQKYIQAKILSVQELLPDYGYLRNALTGNLIAYGDNYPRNTFLENLNESENIAKLSGVKLTNIIGNLDNNQSTISKIRIVESTEAEKWEHGMPEDFYAESGDNGLEMGEGDETVPKVSAELFPPDPMEGINSSHSDLPTEAQCEIIGKLTSGATCYYTDKINIPNILLINIFSPIDIQIVDPNNKKVGKDFITGEIINEIDGAYYSGAGAENEFLTIPNPADGEYKILTQGTGDGEYKIEVAKIVENPTTGIVDESVAEITGNTIFGQEGEKEIKVAGTEVSAGIQDTLAPEISITSPEENKTYLNNQIIPVNYQVTDNQSLAEKIQSQVALDGVSLTGNNIVLALQNLGEHKLKIIATDEVGNKSEKEISFRVETNIKALIDNINHYATLNLIKNKADKTVLISRLKLIQEIEKLIKTIENCRFFKSKTKEKLIQVLEKQIDRHLDWLIDYVEKRSNSKAKNRIDPKAGNLLIESLFFLKSN